jgi:uncharacterized phiE125 gp8 family phage protein
MVPLAKLKTAPAQRVVSLNALKDFLRIDTSDDDNLLTSLLKAAEQRLEKESELKFVNQTWEIYFDSFPLRMKNEAWWDGVREGAITQLYDRTKGEINLPFGPISSFTSLSYFPEDGSEETYPASNYVVDDIGYRGRIRLKTGSIWPAVVLRPLNAVKIEAVFGFGNGYIGGAEPVDSQVPQDIQEAVLNFAAVLYEHRGDEMPEIPSSVLMLLKPYTRYKV